MYIHVHTCITCTYIYIQPIIETFSLTLMTTFRYNNIVPSLSNFLFS